MATAAAQQPFQTPAAPVAGFSPLQQQAFGQIQNTQGIANPYFQQANNLFNQSAQPISGQQVDQYLNPYISNVTANLKDIFGQQMSQTTGNLQQQAGGVGADRIAVGQSELAKQQGLAAGQTYSGIYGSALSAAQQDAQRQQASAFGLGNLGPTVQNTALQGSQALLGAGGLQQQLSQAQLNSPYQQQLQQLAYPFQTAQYLSGITAGLAPGMGGTTSGQTSYPGPSTLSQVLGGGLAGVGLLGGTGAFGSNGYLNSAFGSSPSYGGGNMFSGDAYGGSGSNPLPGLTAADYGAGFAGGGDVGGGIGDDPFKDEGGMSIVPNIAMHPASTPHPFDPPKPPSSGGGTSGGSGFGIGDVVKAATSIAPFFALKRGGRAYPRAFGGSVSPYDAGAHFQAGGEIDMTDMEPIQDVDADSYRAWRTGVDQDRGLGQSAQPITTPVPTSAVADNSVQGRSPVPNVGFPRAPAGNPNTPAASEPTAGPWLSAVTEKPPEDWGSGFAKSPWSALTAAGLGIMAGTSPYAGVNIGKGGLEGIKALEQQRKSGQNDTHLELEAERLHQTAEQHRKELAQRAELHNTMTPYQRGELVKPFKIGTDRMGGDVYGIRTPEGKIQVINPATGTPTGSPVNGVPGTQMPSPTPISATGPMQAELKKPNERVGETFSAVDEGQLPAGSAPAQAGPVNEAALEGLSDTDKSLVKGLADYSISPTSLSIRGNRRERVLGLALQYDPSYRMPIYASRAAAIKEFNAGGINSPAGQITAGNTAVQHLGEMSDAAEHLGDVGSGIASKLNQVGAQGIPIISYAANQLRNAAVRGTPEGQALQQFVAARNHYAEEIARFYSGSAGSEAERDRAIAIVDAAKSVPELRAAFQQEAALIKGKVNALQARYQNAIGGTGWDRAVGESARANEFPIVQKTSQDAINKITGRYMLTVHPQQYGPAAGGQAAPTGAPAGGVPQMVHSKDQYDQLPPNTEFMGADGKRYRKP